MKRYFLPILLVLASGSIVVAKEVITQIKPLADEYWWNGIVRHGMMMPLKPEYKSDMRERNYSNQCQPLLLSNKGRYVWGETALGIEVKKDGTIELASDRDLSVVTAGKTLREAYLSVMKKQFPPSGKLPDRTLFTAPQFNNWIELGTKQYQHEIIRYARNAAKYFPVGVMMIDAGWQQGQGMWDFDRTKIPNPKQMIDTLHQLGFKVMLWVTPHVKPNTAESEERLKAGHLLMTSQGVPFLLKWWSGTDYVYDFSNPDAVKHYTEKMNYLVKRYGVDGIKFDAGDHNFYNGDTKPFKLGTTPQDHSMLFAQIGLQFPLNEYRACWKMANQPLAQRLQDKNFYWSELKPLITDMAVQGLSGYAFGCPDMVGGGDRATFKENEPIDQELMVRSAQISALMPMMQFSVAPWRVLSSENFQIVKDAVALRQKLLPYIMKFVEAAAKTGEPVMRFMEYQYPNEGFAQCIDQFALGDSYIVSPMTEKGTSRTVKLPKGKWMDEQGKIYDGGRTYTIDVPIERLPYFKLVR